MNLAFTVDADGWVSAARKLPSPNFEARPEGAVPTLIVVHNISLPPNEFGGTAIAELFQNTLDCDAHPYYDTHLRGVRVSAYWAALALQRCCLGSLLGSTLPAVSRCSEYLIPPFRVFSHLSRHHFPFTVDLSCRRVGRQVGR